MVPVVTASKVGQAELRGNVDKMNTAKIWALSCMSKH